MKLLKLFAAAAVSCFFASSASAGGALMFLTTETEVNSDQPQGWMNRFADWNQTGTFTAPNLSSAVSVKTSRTSDAVVVQFKIPDKSTRVPGTPATALVQGDKVILQFDTGATPAASITSGKSIRFEVQIGGSIGGQAFFDAIARANRSSPIAGPGGSTIWGSVAPITNFTKTSSAPAGCPSSTSAPCVDMAKTDASDPSFSGYVVTFRIPISVAMTSGGLGLPTALPSDIGMAFAIINDLGTTIMVGGQNKDALTAVSFPFGDMPIGVSPFDDPGIVTPATNASVWLQPHKWGRALFSQPTSPQTALTLNPGPQAWLSDSIKLADCSAGRWQDIPAATTSGSQNALPLWYRYFPANPCKMGVWVRATNTGTVPATTRMLVLWGDAGLSINKWRVVELTPPISFGAGKSTSRVIWDKVPSGGSASGSTTHPCMKVYLLPAALNAVDPNTNVTQDEAKIKAISDAASLAAFERAYGFNGVNNPQVAQMNFTNLDAADKECPAGVCVQPMKITRSTETTGQWFAMLGLGSAWAQLASTAGTERQATPVGRDGDKPPPAERDPWFGIEVHGFGVPAAPPAVPYVFFQAIGGLAWAVPYRLVNRDALALRFNIGNPQLALRDFNATPIREIPSPTQRILLTTIVNAPAGVPVPKVTTVGGDDRGLEAGQTAPARVDVAPTPIGSDNPLTAFLSCLRAGDWRCWLIVLLIIAFSVVIWRRRSSSSP